MAKQDGTTIDARADGVVVQRSQRGAVVTVTDVLGVASRARPVLVDLEGPRLLGAGLARLSPAEVLAVQGLLAFDGSEGKRTTVRALGLKSAEELEDVTVHGAPPALVEKARQKLARIGAAS